MGIRLITREQAESQSEVAGASQRAKARKFSACAELFRVDATAHPAAIRTMLAGCPGTSECRSWGEGLHDSGTQALAWLDANPSSDALLDECTRLFGGKDWVATMPLVPPCACSYLSPAVDGVISDVLVAYDAAGFAPRTEDRRCAAHISNELEFMSHCLKGAAAGETDQLLMSRAFVVAHLYQWGVVFAAATYARAENPVLRFAGSILEQLLFCEYGHAAASESSYRGLQPSLGC